MQLIENVIVGPIVAVLSFVCSVGNVPLAAVLWAGGISFSGVIAFIYADLIVDPDRPDLPEVLRLEGDLALIVAIMFVTIVIAALAVSTASSARSASCRPSRPSIESITERAITWNYTTALNIVVPRRRGRALGADAPARREGPGLRDDRRPARRPRTERRGGGKHVYFCSARLQESLRRGSGALRLRPRASRPHGARSLGRRLTQALDLRAALLLVEPPLP